MSSYIILEIEANNNNGFQIKDYDSTTNLLTGSNITINWGDGNTETYNGTINHTYESTGEYTIRISGEISAIKTYFLRGNDTIIKAKLYVSIDSIGAWFMSECDRLEEVEIEGSVGTINDFFLYDNHEVTKVTLPENITEIGNEFCSFCYGLKEFHVPYGVTIIGQYFMEYCTTLEKVYIPLSVSYIKSYFLRGCSKLKEVHFESYTPPTLAFYPFRNITNYTLYVPKKTVYKAETNYPTDDDKYHEYSISESIANIYNYLKSILEEDFDMVIDDSQNGDVQGLTSLIDKIDEI